METGARRRHHAGSDTTTTTRPASSSSTGLFNDRGELYQELEDLQRRGLLKQRGGGLVLTGKAYAELARKFPRRRQVRR